MSVSFILRRLISRSPNLHHRHRISSISLFLSHPKPFSSLSSDQPEPKPSSLSARMSFVFDQIDAIEKERSQKDKTLQRIRAWRESKKINKENTTATSNIGSVFNELNNSIESNSNLTELNSVDSEMAKKNEEERVGLLEKKVELVHPWPEWIEFMERLVQQNYFDNRRKDEDKMVQDLGFDMSVVAEEGFDFTRDWKTVQAAVLNFGRDRFDILRSLSRQDIQILVGYGCPSTDKKVIFSAKLLRKHVHLNEGDVCCSCSLRSSCEKAYLLTNKEDEARTLDVIRVLLTYGFDPVIGSVVNKSLLKIKSVKTVVRKLLHEVVKLTAVPIDPNLPPPVIKKPPPKVKLPPPPPQKRVGRDDIEMKKGDWLCPKCDFMNFAKNTICLQCDAKRPKRQLLPGEWECPQCNFLNYRRNMVCFHCEHKRPPDEYMENQMQDRQRGPRMMLEKVSDKADISNAWNFHFDDNESDGADVAAFEYADSHKLDADFPLERHVQGENHRGPEDDFYKNRRYPRVQEREYSNHGPKGPGTGFNDFDDEDDDVDSYELDARNNNQVQKTSSIDFSEVEVDSESEDIEGTDNDCLARRRRTNSHKHGKPSKAVHGKAAFSGSDKDELDFDSDEDLPAHPNWKSSHVAHFRQRSRGRGPTNFGSDEDIGLSTVNEDDFRSRQNKGNKWGRRDFGKRGRPDIGDEPFSGLESNDHLSFQGYRFKGNHAGSDRRGKMSKGRGGLGVSESSRSNGMIGDRRNSFKGNFNSSYRGSHGRGKSRGFQGDDYDGHRMNARDSGFQNFEGPRREGSYNQQCGKFNNFDNRSDSNLDDDRHRRPRVNVR